MNAEQRIPAIQIENAGDPDFRARARKSLKDDQLRRNFRTAMDSLMTKRGRPSAMPTSASACARWATISAPAPCPSCPNCSSDWKPT